MKTIQMFWHGTAFSVYERLSARSFARFGHRVHVYAYEKLDLPEGVEWRDAAEILPRDAVFAYQHGIGKGSFSAFSNTFRYKLLLDRGGIWADADILCLQSLDALPSNFIGAQDHRILNVALMGLERGSGYARTLYERAAEAGRDVQWGQIGPHLATIVHQNGSFPEVRVLPPASFYPIPWEAAMMMALPSENMRCRKLAESSLCTHWWNEVFRRTGLPKDKLPPKGSLLADFADIILAGEDLSYWDESLVLTWVRNCRDAMAFRAQASGG